jgi:osmotically-inducible protein OsmY
MIDSNKAFPRLTTLALVALFGLAPLLQGCFGMAVVGAGAMAVSAADRRTLGAQAEDQEIELRGDSRIGDRIGDKAHISVTSYNRNILLTGEAIDPAARAQAESIVREIPNVRGVVNAIQISAPSSYTSRANDSYLTSKVKARFIDNGGSFSAQFGQGSDRGRRRIPAGAGQPQGSRRGGGNRAHHRRRAKSGARIRVHRDPGQVTTGA